MAAPTTPTSWVNDSFKEEFDSFENESNNELYSLYNTFMTFSFIMNIFKDIFLGGVVIILELITIYMFCRFKKLRKKLNLYILNLCCLDLVSQLKAIVDFFIIEAVSDINEKLFCSVIQLYKFLLMLYFTLCFCLACDWFVICVRPHLFENHDYVRKIVIISINLFFIILYVTVINFNCFSSTMFYLGWPENAIYILYFIFLIGIITLHVIVYRLQLKKAYMHTFYLFDVATVIISSFLPMLIYHFILIYFEIHLIVELIFLYTMFIPQILAHAHFVIILFILYKHNIEVRNIFVRHFKVLEDFNDDKTLSTNMENEDSTYVHADNFGSVEDTRRLSEF